MFINSAGIQKNPTLTWGGQYKKLTEIQLPLHSDDGTLITKGIYMLPLVDAIMANSQYVVRAHVVDNYGCHGVDANSTYLVGTYILQKMISITNDLVKMD